MTAASVVVVGGSFVRRLIVEDVSELRSRVLEKFGASNPDRQAARQETLVGRWSAAVSEPHCVRERDSDFERLVGQNFWRPEPLVKQVGDFASPGKADTVPCGEEPTRVFPGAVCEIFLDIGGEIGSAADLDCCSEIYQWLSQTRKDEWWHG